MLDIYDKLFKLLFDSCNQCTSNTIALSGGLDSTILAYMLRNKRPHGVTVIADDFTATDLTYCQIVSKKFNMSHYITSTKTTDILDAIKETIKILGNFNDIEIRNNVVIYLAIKWAKENNINGIITGDGADELFAGYYFLQKNPDNLKKELERIHSIMHFPSQIIAKNLKVTIESPFLNEKIIEFAKNIPTELLLQKKDGKIYGKWILRKTFEKFIPSQIAWRAKSPMQDGAGTSGLTSMFNSIITDENFNQQKNDIFEKDGVKIRTKESLHYYTTYRKMYKIPTTKTHTACPYCKYDISKSRFCRMCGAFPV